MDGKGLKTVYLNHSSPPSLGPEDQHCMPFESTKAKSEGERTQVQKITLPMTCTKTEHKKVPDSCKMCNKTNDHLSAAVN